MSKKKKEIKHRSHSFMVEIPEPRYRRWKLADKNNDRVLIIDFRCIRATKWKPIDYGARRAYKWRNPEQLQKFVDAYFESCYGPVRNPKTGELYTNPDGSFVLGQIKPFTVSGLALYIHVATEVLKTYTREAIDALGYPLNADYSGPLYSEIVLEAIRKIENYAEERLYDRDGFGGGRFVLNAAFGWTEKKEQAEINNMKEQNKLKKKELKFKKQQAAIGEMTDEPVTITIRRAGESQ